MWKIKKHIINMMVSGMFMAINVQKIADFDGNAINNNNMAC